MISPDQPDLYTHLSGVSELVPGTSGRHKTATTHPKVECLVHITRDPPTTFLPKLGSVCAEENTAGCPECFEDVLLIYSCHNDKQKARAVIEIMTRTTHVVRQPIGHSSCTYTALSEGRGVR